ncbi:hypothetical protein DPMN_085527 [Dreissena polymorpha]|uniref:Uncharacterized protein n=1 Tax=Dreissena polymorpha TaxID=45954 RepID=A0A9D3YGN2_DREPO|nr:hypothetical protein DPMN_085527 [Dreissena polymorpha]
MAALQYKTRIRFRWSSSGHRRYSESCRCEEDGTRLKRNEAESLQRSLQLHHDSALEDTIAAKRVSVMMRSRNLRQFLS